MVDCGGPVVCKPLWNGRVPTENGEKIFFTSIVDPLLPHAERLGPEPYLFQELVPKEYDLRVTVIGEELFATRIASQARQETRTDWRRGSPSGIRHTPDRLPDQVSEGCIALCHHYGLRFACVDLAKRPDGGFTFFEINPNGQWAWIEQLTGVPLRAKLVDLLVGGALTGAMY
jgi:glutathione synthase/RimK-type ligase-like ATP-grasp enzyme